MQTFPSAPAHLLLPSLALLSLALLPLAPPAAFAAAPAKPHSVTLGPIRKVPYTPPTAAPSSDGSTDAITLKVRALYVDGRQKEWTTGDVHDVTDRSFTIRRALRLNDALPTDRAPQWTWQPGPWLLIDRSTGRITALHLPDFDPIVSDAVWFRDYAAYCGAAQTARGGLFAIVAQIGVRRAVVQKQIGKWPQPSPPDPVCQPATWQRAPMRVTLQPTGGAPITFNIVGAASLIEEDDNSDTN